MMYYSVQPRNKIFVKGYGFLFFVKKNISKSISTNIGKKLSSKYNQKRLDRNKQSATDTLKTASKKNNSKNIWSFDW